LGVLLSTAQGRGALEHRCPQHPQTQLRARLEQRPRVPVGEEPARWN